MASIILPNVEATIELGRDFASRVNAGGVLALIGDLGAGKTHFVKGLAIGLGTSTEATSPTFTLIHEYRDGRLPLFHFDLYRLESDDELLRIGFDDYLDSAGVLAIEWADKFPALMPPQTKWLRFSHRADGAREVDVS